jgi:hypothetical protein
VSAHATGIGRDFSVNPSAAARGNPAAWHLTWGFTGWQVLGSNQRRLSRRFYRPPIFETVSAARCTCCRLSQSASDGRYRPAASRLGLTWLVCSATFRGACVAPAAPARLQGSRSLSLFHPDLGVRLFHPNLGWEPVNLYVMRRVRWSIRWPRWPLSAGVTARSRGDARPAGPARPPASGCHEQSAVDRADRAGPLGELSQVLQTTPVGLAGRLASPRPDPPRQPAQRQPARDRLQGHQGGPGASIGRPYQPRPGPCGVLPRVLGAPAWPPPGQRHRSLTGRFRPSA